MVQKPGYVRQFKGPIPEANKPPRKYKAYESVTEGGAWAKADMLLQHGMTPSEVPTFDPVSNAFHV